MAAPPDFDYDEDLKRKYIEGLIYADNQPNRTLKSILNHPLGEAGSRYILQYLKLARAAGFTKPLRNCSPEELRTLLQWMYESWYWVRPPNARPVPVLPRSLVP